MSKGIILVDIPENCHKCLFQNDGCNITYMNVDLYIIHKTKPEWCPIKPLPEKDNSDTSGYYLDEYPQGYKNGWNECIDKILEGAADEEKEPLTVTEIIEDVRNDICSNFCKYAEECDQKMEKNEEPRKCPLDRL